MEKLIGTIQIIVVLILFAACEKKQNAPENGNDLLDSLALRDVNKNVLVGSHVEVEDGSEAYKNVIKTEFNTGQGLWYARWNGGWTGDGVYNFQLFNDNVNWMKANGISPAMHMMVGPNNYMPDWLIQGNWSPTKLDSMLRNMIYSIMETNDNKNKVEEWNVANELFDDDGTYRRDMVWNQIGWESDNSGLTNEDKINDRHPLFVRKALQYCREKTNAKLELREYNIESNDPATGNDKRHKAMYQLIKHLLAERVPIDAVGIQGHLDVGKSAWRLRNNTLQNTVAKFRTLNIEVYITELDAGIGSQSWSADIAQKQKDDFYNYILQAVRGGVTRIYFWGIQDGKDKGWLTNEYPLLWDKDLNKKPAYNGAKQALMDGKN